MSFNIDLNIIKNGLTDAYHTVVMKSSEWMGRTVTVIKTGTDNALPYLQDKKIAVISLIGVTLILGELVNYLTNILNAHFPNKTALQRGMRDFIDFAGGLSIIAAGVIGFAKVTKLPLSLVAIIGISTAAIVARAALSNIYKSHASN